MNGRREVKLAGMGGQGLILGGLVLAEAGILDGKNVTQAQSYGAQVRGGPSSSEVILSDEVIDFPRVLEVDFLIALTQEAYDRYAHQVKKNGLIIVDADLVERVSAEQVVRVPMEKIARAETGSNAAITMVALGVLAGLTRIVSKSSLSAAIATRTPKGSVPANKRAFLAGFGLAKTLRKPRKERTASVASQSPS